MQVHRSIDALPSFRRSVITIGTFDGVHQGHRKIIAALREEAQRVHGESVIITFDPHPRKVVQPSVQLHLINTLDEKIELLQSAGIDHLVIVPFTESFAALTASEYITDFLVKKFAPHTIIIGYDHHFGKGRSGNFELLQKEAALHGYVLIEIPKQVLDAIAVSSTKIRNALLQSDVDTASKLLGYTYFFEGKVVPGDRLGRELGYPTANLQYTDEEKIHLGHGVYAVYADIRNRPYKGMLSIGTRPTLDKPEEKVEVHIFNWSEELYGEIIRIRVAHYLRPQEKYESLQALVEQLHRDKEDSLRLL